MKYTLLDTDNYFDQSEAVHCFLTLNHEGQSSKKYELLCRSEFKPGHSWSESRVESENEFYSEVESWSDENIETFMDELDAFFEEDNSEDDIEEDDSDDE